ncbi:hypothetical protein JQ628_07815 [Bradyrhizobium lablabi]|uniref:hypothetical protein n=1 Tax=Bradyrhizobium lablabi TaxID=722472 RepID=UPI001BAA658B|nr:hypothetical protein [Bradyrhizobium lablabi]MBR1121419.1 hypothetical protein [Bradyrhizobium lablabi]
MTLRNAIASSLVLQWLLLAVPAAPALSAADGTRVQFCWALGKFDHTVYFAEAEVREDRQTSFTELLDISGIDHDLVECRLSDSGSFRSVRAELMKTWADSEFEIINTTFLSDLDY